jgi:DNA-directed DNA polymerase III PolC
MLSGASSTSVIINEAKEKGFDSISITDTNGMYGVVEFGKLCKENKLKPIYGSLIDEPDSKNYLILMAKNTEGITEINKAITDRQLNDDFLIEKYIPLKSPNLFFITPKVEILKLFKTYEDKNIFAELILTDGKTYPRGYRDYLNYMVENHIPLLATNNVHFTRKDEHFIHKVLTAIRLNKTIYDVGETELAHEEHWLKNKDEMNNLFKEFPDALINTKYIVQNCNVDLKIGEYKYPKFPLPSKETSFSFLWKLCFDGISKRYSPLTKDAIDRLKRELEIIEKLDFADYFLIVWDLNEEAKRRGFKTIGRGSAANSIVSYTLGITHVDPIKHNLFFERFINPERTSPPDIDLDFSWKDRDEILNYAYEKYGHERVAMISTHITFAARSAVREVGKAYGIGDDEITRFNRYVPHTSAENLPFLKEKYPECKNLPTDEEPWKTILKIGNLIAHYPRHLSIHAGGIIICPEPLFKFTALQRSDKGFVVTQPDMYPIEELGLLKIDLLSQRSLGVFQDVYKQIKDRCKIDLENYEVVFNDKETKRIMREGKTIGCFYIESPGMRSLLKKLNSDSFEMLTIASSIIRPGVAESGMMQEFINRHKDPSRRIYKHPALKEILGETYGVMVYQEDCIKVANKIAGMSLSRADLLRRAMSGKMRSRDAMKELKDEFLEGCSKNNVTSEIADEIWFQISSFAGYAFCKAHSASFALFSFQMAYLKSHFPAEFIAAVLSNQGGYYQPSVYIQEARRLGLKILLPCINRSDYLYIGKEDWIRIGFVQIKDLSDKATEKIIESRQMNGKFTSLSEFINITRIDYSDATILIRCGAMDCFELTRPELLCRLKILYNDNRKIDSDLTSDLFKDHRRKISTLVPSIPDYSFNEKCQIEYDMFGFMVSAHPLEFFEKQINSMEVVKAKDMHRHIGKNIKMIGWWVTDKRIKTKTNKFMKFLSLEDLTGTFEATLFPAVYTKYSYLLHYPGPYLIEGVIEKESLDTIIVNKVTILKDADIPFRVKRETVNISDEEPDSFLE